VRRITQEQIIQGIKKRDNTVLKYIYKRFYPIILKFILINNGSIEDAKDVFQETIITMFKDVRENPNFKLDCNIQTYIYSISRIIWLKHLRFLKTDGFVPLVDTEKYIYFTEPGPFPDEDLRYAIFQKAFLKLPPDCRDILKMTIDGFSQDEIAASLGLTSRKYIKKRKHFCKEHLINLIKEDPDYQEEFE